MSREKTEVLISISDSLKRISMALHSWQPDIVTIGERELSPTTEGFPEVRWVSCKEQLPDSTRPVLVVGYTGSESPYDVFVGSAYYQPLYENLSLRWRNLYGDALRDTDFEPLAWAEMINIPDLLSLAREATI